MGGKILRADEEGGWRDLLQGGLGRGVEERGEKEVCGCGCGCLSLRGGGLELCVVVFVQTCVLIIYPYTKPPPAPSNTQRKARVQLGREQTDKSIIGRFSAKLGEALGKIDPKVYIYI